jgi:septal ring factor EnvC (AmiA/AmiB activator)
MAGEAAFSANDAAVSVQDRDTEIQQAKAAVAFLERDLATYPDRLDRLRAKLVKAENAVIAVEAQIDELKADEQKANAELQTAYEAVTALTGE